MKLPILKAFGAGLAYFGSHAPGLLKAIWLPTLIMTAVTVYALPRYMEPMLAVMEMGPEPNPQAAMAAMGPGIRWLGILFLSSLILYPMVNVGAMRHVLRGDTLKAPFYLGFGADEIRVLATFLLLIIMMVLVSLVGMIGLLAITAAGAALGGAVGAMLSLVGILAFFGGFLWMAMRLSLSLPATVAERRIGLPVSWAMGKGNSLRLFVYFLLWLLVILPFAVAYIFSTVPGFLEYMSEIAAAGTNEAALNEIQARMQRAQIEALKPSSPGFPLRVAILYLYNLLTLAWGAVAPAIAYRYIAGETARS